MNVEQLPVLNVGDFRSTTTSPRKPIVAGCCPKCGGDEYQTIKKSSQFVSFGRDRVCTKCSTRYVPATPLWCAPIYIIGGLVLTPFLGLGGFLGLTIFAAMFQVGNVPPDAAIPYALALIAGGVFAAVSSSGGLWGIFAVFHGIRVLIYPGHY